MPIFLYIWRGYAISTEPDIHTMGYWLLVFLVSTQIPSVYAGNWDGFASNLATDLV